MPDEPHIDARSIEARIAADSRFNQFLWRRPWVMRLFLWAMAAGFGVLVWFVTHWILDDKDVRDGIPVLLGLAVAGWIINVNREKPRRDTMDPKKRLNGWQRIWVTASGLWLAIIATFLLAIALTGDDLSHVQWGALFLLWLVPTVGAYAIGLAVRWIRQGFSGK